MRKVVAGIPLLLAGASITAAAELTLLDAVESGDRATAVRLLSSKGANVNAPGPDGTTAIMYAAANGDVELVRALIKAGADVKAKNQFGTSALTESAITGNAPIIRELLKAGADPNFRTPDGETPLMAAARSGNIDGAKALLDAGADINAKETWGGQSALMWASAQSQAEMVKFLASSKGANLNDHGKINQWERKVIQEPRPKDMNKGGFTPLHYASREGCALCVQYLLEAGADPDSEDPDRETPLLLALENLHFDTAAVLVKGGADLDKWDLFGRSPVYMAADVSTLPMKGNGAMAVLPSPDKLSALDLGRMMLEKGANPNIQLKRRPPYRDVPQDRGGDQMLAQGATPLLRAARAGDNKFVALLLEYKALVDLPSKEGITPLMAAAGVDYGLRVTRGRNRTEEGVLATMDLLIKAGADVNARDVMDRRIGRGYTPGESAATAASTRARRDSQVPSANAVPNQTALHGAAEHGFDKFIEFLVAHGADLTAKDATGRTPLDAARGAGGQKGGADAFPKTVALLESMMKEKGIPIPPAPAKAEK
ncbi:MAG: ankyrin repeat domain-containing protein [Bryobacterales bacterium]|nr:ankyrin repeat domain-containing protein [Bryobacterales bacterium]MBV9400837.1 ankyrin repeat domain-containing protein [Bryobacterales bacterium]